MKQLIIVFLGLFLFQATYAQEEAIYRQYFLNPILVNPASVGVNRDIHRLDMNLRSSFTSFSGAPQTYTLSYNGPVGSKVGLGGLISSDNVADLTRFRAQMAYSMGIDVNQVKFRAGLSLEYQRMSLSNDVFDSDNLEIGDDVINENTDGERIFDTSLGILGEFKNFTFGYAAPNLIRTVTDEIEGQDDGGNFKYFILHAGGTFNVNEKVKLEPSAILRRVRDVDTHLDLALMASFLNEQFLTGAMMRTGAGSSIGFLLGTKYNSLKFIYSYDLLLDEFQKYNSGSHEITVGFEFGRKESKLDRSRKYRE